MKKTIWSIRLIFILLFILIATYIVFIETQRYESASIVGLKDLSQKQEMSLGSLLMGKGSEIVKDSNILELYIRSFEMYDRLDAIYQLSDYYTSETLDSYQRLSEDAFLPAFKINRENLLKAYNEDLFLIFDNVSETIALKFAHADKNTSRQIVEHIITFSDKVINNFSRKSAAISLEFISNQVEENRQLFIASIETMILYQHQHKTFDPHMDVERKYIIIAELEADLAKKEIEYSSKLKTNWNVRGLEMKTLKANIENIIKSIKKMNRELSGNQKNVRELNVNVFDFEVLKNEMEFAKEVYRETLISQEKLKIEVNQNAKHLVVITKPTHPDEYTYPNKVWDLFTLFLTLFFLYSIVMTGLTILRDHKD